MNDHSKLEKIVIKMIPVIVECGGGGESVLMGITFITHSSKANRY